MPKISIIVPVCNVEKYLSKCLDSIVNQTLKEIEIICIDDGSVFCRKCMRNYIELAKNQIWILSSQMQFSGGRELVILTMSIMIILMNIMIKYLLAMTGICFTSFS